MWGQSKGPFQLVIGYRNREKFNRLFFANNDGPYIRLLIFTLTYAPARARSRRA